MNYDMTENKKTNKRNVLAVQIKLHLNFDIAKPMIDVLMLLRIATRKYNFSEIPIY